MQTSGYRSITVGVTDLDAALRLFRDVMQLRVEAQGNVPAQQLQFWGLPELRARYAELSCRGYPIGRLQLVAFDPPATNKVRDDFGVDAVDSPLDIGPKAIDFYVAAPIADWVAKVEAAGFPARSAPRRHQIGESISEEVVISGPNDLPILLMVGHRHSVRSLRPGSPDGPFSEIATASVVCGDLAQSRAFYEAAGFVAVNDAETPPRYRDLVCELVDAPAGTRIHFLLYASPGEASGKILLIHFHGTPGRRLTGRMRPGHLGFSLFQHDVDDVSALRAALANCSAQIVAGPERILTPRGARIALMVRGPNEEHFEFSHPG